VSTEGLPWRGPGPRRPDLPLPPEERPKLRQNGNWRKRWRYLSAFSDEVMLCAARVGVGPFGQTFWAVWDREARELTERTRMIIPMLARGEVWTEHSPDENEPGQVEWAPDGGKLRVRIEAPERKGDARTRAFLGVESAGPWAEAVCATGEGDGWVWTRKRPVVVDVDVRFGDRRIRCQARGIEDESCGYHPHQTVWDWSAGVGTTVDGRAIAWNLVSGVNDPPERSERAIWVGGAVSEPSPVTFEGLEAINFGDGARLVCNAEAERSRTESKPIVSYSYRQPFGTFKGTLPGGLELSSGFGVMEHHDANW
jgi:Protein of unknown function (DUF2804)